MEPFERFKKLATHGNLWIWVLNLAKEEVLEDEVLKLIFEKYEFLPSNLLLKTVIFKLKNSGYIEVKKYKGKKALKITEKGKEELEKVESFLKDLLAKI
jgi:DNA-binding PadR family transcriptional regulator